LKQEKLEERKKRRKELETKDKAERTVRIDEFLKVNNVIKVLCMRSLTKLEVGPPYCKTEYIAPKGGQVKKDFQFVGIEKTKHHITHLEINNVFKCPRCYKRRQHSLNKKNDRPFFRNFRNELYPVQPLPQEKEDEFEMSDSD
jgi:hypothetical protein